MFRSPQFVTTVKIGIVTLNAYYFLIRRNGLWECLKNLIPQGKRRTWLTQRKAVEVLLTCYIGGVVLIPGQHKQFQMWYLELLPLLVAISGIQPLLIFAAYNNMFPANVVFEERVPHFLLLVALITLMLTVGPVNMVFI